MRSRAIRALFVSAAAGLLLISSAIQADPPLESGRVIRSETYTGGFSWPDFKTGYQVIVGFDVYEYCADVYNFSVFPLQLVDVPNVDDRFILNGSAYVPVQVFDFVEWDCDFFTAFGPVAAGMAEFHWTDNDVFGTFETNAARAWGFNVHGKLTDMNTGELRTLAAKLRFSANTQSGKFKVHSTVQLH